MIKFLKKIITGTSEPQDTNKKDVTPPASSSIPFLTPDKVKTILKDNKDYMEWYNLLEKYFNIYNINTKNRVGSFLGQTAHESNYFNNLEENLYYTTTSRLLSVFPKYINMSNATKYLKNPKALANLVYANRNGNRNEESGDGYLYHGRGLIQMTFFDNYNLFSKEIQKSVPDTVNYLSTKEGAVHSACYFWSKHNINALADIRNDKGITKIINGGYNGLADRISKTEEIIKIL